MKTTATILFLMLIHSISSASATDISYIGCSEDGEEEILVLQTKQHGTKEISFLNGNGDEGALLCSRIQLQLREWLDKPEEEKRSQLYQICNCHKPMFGSFDLGSFQIRSEIKISCTVINPDGLFVSGEKRTRSIGDCTDCGQEALSNCYDMANSRTGIVRP